jgi:hypothetical protein
MVRIAAEWRRRDGIVIGTDPGVMDVTREQIQARTGVPLI